MANAFDTFVDPSAASQGSLSANSIFDIGNAVSSANNVLGLSNSQSSPSSEDNQSFWQQFWQILPQVPGISPAPLGNIPPNPGNFPGNPAGSGVVKDLFNGRYISIIIGIVFIIVGLVLLGKSPILQSVKTTGKQLALAA